MFNASLRILKRQLFFIDSNEVSLEKRGFRKVDSATQRHLESIGWAFLQGYHRALGLTSSNVNPPYPSEFYRGFEFEGAAMAAALMDGFSFRSYRRVRNLLESAGDRYEYLIHVGIGWAMARIPWQRQRPESVLRSFDAILRWLILDGFGFHEGYFHWQTSILQMRYPRGFKGYAKRAFDQGLGRSMWFVSGADPVRIHEAIGRFEQKRRADLWSGIGLACGYAGGMDHRILEKLGDFSSDFRNSLAQGVVFAVAARHQGQHMSDDATHACHAICGMETSEAVRLCYESLDVAKHSKGNESTPTFELWRTKIRNEFVRNRSATVTTG